MKSIKYPLLVLAIAALSLCAGASAEQVEPPLFFSSEMIAVHLSGYTAEEKEAIERDRSVVRSICFPEQNEPSRRKPLYLATAGGPGSRKTSILESFLAQQPYGSKIAYVDPDARTLLFMAHTYYNRSLAVGQLPFYPSYLAARKAAYEKWRGASNYIALTLLEEAFQEHRDIAHGTTSTGGHVDAFLSRVKEVGYEVSLLLCYADDELRKEAIAYRNAEQKFYQSTPEDGVSKGLLFPQRMPIYFAHADTLHLFWSDSLFSSPRLAARLEDGAMQVMDEEALDCFMAQFEKDRARLAKEGISLPSWDELIASYKNSSFSR